MNHNESMEDYLETILILSQKNPTVRSIDIAIETGYKKSSVSVAMKNLREKGYITMDSDRLIHLTPMGKDLADKVYERHTLLSKWLTDLGVAPETAAEDACRIEHVISKESFEALKKRITGD